MVLECAVTFVSREPAVGEIHHACVIEHGSCKDSICDVIPGKFTENDFLDALHEQIRVVGGKEVCEVALFPRKVRKALMEKEPERATHTADVTLGFRDWIDAGTTLIHCRKQFEMMQTADVCGSGQWVVGIGACAGSEWCWFAPQWVRYGLERGEEDGELFDFTRIHTVCLVPPKAFVALATNSFF